METRKVIVRSRSSYHTTAVTPMQHNGFWVLEHWLAGARATGCKERICDSVLCPRERAPLDLPASRLTRIRYRESGRTGYRDIHLYCRGAVDAWITRLTEKVGQQRILVGQLFLQLVDDTTKQHGFAFARIALDPQHLTSFIGMPLQVLGIFQDSDIGIY